MTKFKKFLLTGFLFSSQMALAGGWTSGGGELIRDAHNPWFLSNTKEVKYCIKINEKDFGQNKSFVRLNIFKALDFWKMQLNELTYVGNSSGFKFTLGTQNFYEVNCDQNPDITFQFAELTKEQEEKLGDLSKTIAVSVRTDYDLVNLKGKGFVYFNKDAQFAELPWTRTEGSRVLPILIHELGHIFGIQHTNDIHMMTETYPEELIDSRNNNWVDAMTTHMSQGENYKQEHLFTYHQSYLMMYSCMSSTPIPKPITIAVKQSEIFSTFFGRNAKDNCMSNYIIGQTFKFYSGHDKNELIGEAQLRMEDLSTVYGLLKAKTIVSFWLPAEQMVFPMNEWEKSNKISIAKFQPVQNFKGTYETLDHKIKREIAIEASNSGGIKKITGVLNNEIFLDIQSGF